MEAEAAETHREAAELDDNVGAAGDLADRPAPFGVDLVAPSGETGDADRSADVIENNARTGKRPRQIEHLLELRVVSPHIERKIGGLETGKPAAKFRLLKEARRRRPQGRPYLLIGIPRGDLADTLEASAAGGDVLAQNVGNLAAEP